MEGPREREQPERRDTPRDEDGDEFADAPEEFERVAGPADLDAPPAADASPADAFPVSEGAAGTAAPEAAPAPAEEAALPHHRIVIEPVRELAVEGSLVRCPYCHSDVKPEKNDWVACRSCLARHHEACWREGKRCATCGKKKYLVAAPKRSAASLHEELRGLRQHGTLTGFVLALGRLTLTTAAVVVGIMTPCLVSALIAEKPVLGVPTAIALALVGVIWLVKTIKARREEREYQRRRRAEQRRRLPGGGD